MKILFFHPGKVYEDGYGNSSDDLFYALEERLMMRGHKLIRTYSDCTEPVDFALLYGAPDKAKLIPQGTPYGVYSMWETDEPPIEWDAYMKGAVFVANPSEWGARSFEKQYGLQVVHTVPLAFKNEVFKYPYNGHTQRDERYTFLSYNSGFGAARKGFFELIEAFKLAFKPTDPVRLIIKSSRPDFWDQKGNRIVWDMMTWTKENGRYENIEYIAESMPGSELRELILQSDCFVFPSRGEGWGHTPLEAMSCGLPVIIPNQHAFTEYFNEVFCIGYDVDWEPAKFDTPYTIAGKWPVAKKESLATALLTMYNTGKRKSSLLGISTTAWANQYTYERTARHLVELIETNL